MIDSVALVSTVQQSDPVLCVCVCVCVCVYILVSHTVFCPEILDVVPRAGLFLSKGHFTVCKMGNTATTSFIVSSKSKIHINGNVLAYIFGCDYLFHSSFRILGVPYICKSKSRCVWIGQVRNNHVVTSVKKNPSCREKGTF